MGGVLESITPWLSQNLAGIISLIVLITLWLKVDAQAEVINALKALDLPQWAARFEAYATLKDQEADAKIAAARRKADAEIEVIHRQAEEEKGTLTREASAVFDMARDETFEAVKAIIALLRFAPGSVRTQVIEAAGIGEPTKQVLRSLAANTPEPEPSFGQFLAAIPPGPYAPGTLGELAAKGLMALGEPSQTAKIAKPVTLSEMLGEDPKPPAHK